MIRKDTASYRVSPNTHIDQQGYESPQVDQTTTGVRRATVSEDGLEPRLQIDGTLHGHVHDYDFARVRSADGGKPVPAKADYPLNEIPR